MAGTPTTFATFSRVLIDGNGRLITGKTVEIRGVDNTSLIYTLAENTSKPGLYSNASVRCGERYGIYVDGSILEGYEQIAFGSGVGRDAIFLDEHDASGQHTTISCTEITFR